jgi:hypothetical protein
MARNCDSQNMITYVGQNLQDTLTQYLFIGSDALGMAKEADVPRI